MTYAKGMWIVRYGDGDAVTKVHESDLSEDTKACMRRELDQVDEETARHIEEMLDEA